MYNSVRQTLFSNWNVMRMIRLALSVIILTQAVSMQDLTLGLFGGIFMLMAVFNTGCCGGSCGIENTKTATANEKDKIEFEEIK